MATIPRVSLAGQGADVGVAITDASSNACRIYAANLEVTARVVPGVTVAAGDPVLFLRKGSVYYVIAVAPGAPSAVPAAPGPVESQPTDTGDSAPSTKPTTTTGKLVCTPTATSTWRDGHWRTDIGSSTSADTYQGRYSGSSYGRNSGFAFYGSKPRTLAGATVTKATVRLRRLTSGDYAKRTPTLRLVSESSRPSSYPTLHESTPGPALGVINQVSPWSVTYTIPDSWGQAIVDGSRGGIGIVISSDSPYIRLAGKASYSPAWTLTLYWERTS